MKAKDKNRKKRWTAEEEEYLESKWGIVSMATLTKKLGRSKRAIEHRALGMGLGGMYETGDMLLSSEVAKTLGVATSTILCWVRDKGLKAKRVKLKSQQRVLISLDDLIEWLKEHDELWNANKLEYLALGKEPEWLKQKRQRDRNKKWKRTSYTPAEDSKIISLYKMNYTFAEIAKETGRTAYMVKHRIDKLRSLGHKIPYKNAKTHISK